GLAHDIGSGLQTVHEAGIIHRDVKPSNILMSASTHPQREWTAKLADFGIAFGMDDPRLTSPGIAVGTAAYMAPEQVRNEPLTPAVDVYSLGLVLIEALTGEPAFPMTGGVQTALRRLSGPPTLPQSLDPEWRELLQNMTRAEPNERPSAREVAETAASFAAAGPRVVTGWGSASQERGVAGADDPTPTREYPVAEAASTSNGTRGRRIAAGGIAAAAIASIIALAGAQSMSDPADAPAQTVVLEPATSSPAPVVETAQPEQQRASTAVTEGNSSGGAGTTAAKNKAGKAKAGPAARNNSGPGAQDKAKNASNPNKGPGNAGKGAGNADREQPPKGKKK
ncbi:MAG TPA: serine/threonine-protein kinase, partial [Microbacterium sp.]|nr:serine/threonine-protein kinase [Microbacterium sp.]